MQHGDRSGRWRATTRHDTGVVPSSSAAAQARATRAPSWRATASAGGWPRAWRCGSAATPRRGCARTRAPAALGTALAHCVPASSCSLALQASSCALLHSFLWKLNACDVRVNSFKVSWRHEAGSAAGGTRRLSTCRAEPAHGSEPKLLRGSCLHPQGIEARRGAAGTRRSPRRRAAAGGWQRAWRPRSARRPTCPAAPHSRCCTRCSWRPPSRATRTCPGPRWPRRPSA